MSRRALVAAALIGAALCFSLGWLASRAVESPPREPTVTPSSEPRVVETFEAGPSEPLLLIDPSKVVLLPDASLQIDLPTAPEPSGSSGLTPSDRRRPTAVDFDER